MLTFGRLKQIIDAVAAVAAQLTAQAAIWTSTRGTTLDTAKANTDTLLSRWSQAKANFLDQAISSVGGAPTVQTGTFSINQNAATVDITITAVVTTKAVAYIYPDYEWFTDSAPGRIWKLVPSFTSTTNLRLTRNNIYNPPVLAGRWVVMSWPA